MAHDFRSCTRGGANGKLLETISTKELHYPINLGLGDQSGAAPSRPGTPLEVGTQPDWNIHTQLEGARENGPTGS